MLIAQTLAFTPIAFLVLIGVVEGVSPSMEEAAQTLAGEPLANVSHCIIAADAPRAGQRVPSGVHRKHGGFRQPVWFWAGILTCLSTEIFFAIVGAQYDQGRAAVLAMVLVVFHAVGVLRPADVAGQEKLYDGFGQGRCRCPSVDAEWSGDACLCQRRCLGAVHRLVYGMILYGSVVELVGREQLADVQALRHCIFGPIRRKRHPLDGCGVGQLLDDDLHRRSGSATDALSLA